MKKVLFWCLMLVMLVTVCFAGTKVLTFAWQQPGSLDNFGGWKLYQSETAGGAGVLSMTIPYVSQQTEYTATKNLVSPDGQTKTSYFTLTAFDTSGNESGKSNEVSAVIDFEAPTVPIQLKVTVTAGG
jgi:hypothetical protein